MQVLQSRWDATFSEHSHGFRPQRSAHQAVAKAQQYIAAGKRWVVDLDLEKFFDRVNHDRLMAAIARRVNDQRMLKLIRAFLESGVMENGLVSAVEEGTPQGGPLSPLLSNLVLDELDRELERRHHRFVRYADDCNIYVASERAGKRVMQSVTAFHPAPTQAQGEPDEERGGTTAGAKVSGLQLHGASRGQSGVLRRRHLLRFKERDSGTDAPDTRHQPAADGRRNWRPTCADGSATSATAKRPRCCEALESWLRRRLRSVVWKQWKRGRTQVPRTPQTGRPSRTWRRKPPGVLTARGGSRIARPDHCFAQCLLCLSSGFPPMVVRS